jgi:uncharacterized protein
MTEALSRLRRRLSTESRLVVAFSGGVDSALLATVAHEVLGAAALAVTAVSASLPTAERAAARAFARERGIPHLEVCTDELDRPEYVANGGNRCFHCKSALFDALDPLASLLGARIALGTNLDDLGDHRPGQAAAAQRGAIAPMVDAGLAKADVRAASEALGLSTADKPAAACLASRRASKPQKRPCTHSGCSAAGCEPTPTAPWPASNCPRKSWPARSTGAARYPQRCAVPGSCSAHWTSLGCAVAA